LITHSVTAEYERAGRSRRVQQATEPSLGRSADLRGQLGHRDFDSRAKASRKAVTRRLLQTLDAGVHPSAAPEPAAFEIECH
jgi:hypothetical protein